jgi:branched-subunit amino acid transport protein
VNSLDAVVAIAGLAVITVLTRAVFLLFRREPALPTWLQRGLRHAPLAALAAVVAPELVPQGDFAAAWHDPRLYAALAATVYFVWRRGLLGTIASGMAVLLALRLGLGW